MTLPELPYILLNFASSVDGKIAPGDRSQPRFSSEVDRDLMDEIRSGVDAVLVGAATIRAEDPPTRIQSADRRKARIKAGKPRHPLAVVLTSSLDLPFDGRYFSTRGVRKLIVTTETADVTRLQTASGVAAVFQIGVGTVDLLALCSHLKQLGVDRLLVEGGGAVNMAFFSLGLVNEVFMTLCPVIIGGRDAPTPVDGRGFTSETLCRLQLIDSRRIGDELFLRYTVLPT